MRIRTFLLLGGLLLACASRALADPADINARIRNEEAEHSQILHTVHHLADVYGPRLTGSPNARAAGDWAAAQMTAWGMQNAHLEPWLFGHPGWSNLSASGYVTSPVRDQLFFRVLAWTPGTPGPIAANAALIDPPETATKAQLGAYLQSVRGRLKGRIVMVGKGAPAELWTAPAQVDDDFIAQIRRGFVDPQPPDPPRDPNLLTSAERRQQIDAFLIAAGALMRVDNAQEPHGVVRAYANFTYDPAKALPTVELRNEDYGRLARLLNDGETVRLKFDIRNQLYPEGRVGYNTIAEIPGTDKVDEVVVIGAHLDSWHSATGAVDDGIGCAMMMEAGRILMALGVHPRRTIRIALWTGEEQYLLGSQDYVARHFGTAEAPGPAFFKLAAYLNIDGGSGRIRGANMFGPPEDAAILREALKPFADVGVEGAIPQARLDRCDDLLARRPAVDRPDPGPARLLLRLALEPRHLRARRRRPGEAGGYGHRRPGLCARHARRASAPFHRRRHARAGRGAAPGSTDHGPGPALSSAPDRSHPDWAFVRARANRLRGLPTG
jgi:hypothetical protein